jgi:hypothetical protein
MDRPTRRSPLSCIANFSALGVIACVLADATHEMLGHAVAARLLGIRILSVSSVALKPKRDRGWSRPPGRPQISWWAL